MIKLTEREWAQVMLAGAEEESKRLIAALRDALEGLEEMIPYVETYYQVKWNHWGYIHRAKAVLAEFDYDPA